MHDLILKIRESATNLLTIHWEFIQNNNGKILYLKYRIGIGVKKRRNCNLGCQWTLADPGLLTNPDT